MVFGAHVPSADPLAAADARGAELVQVFLSAPRAWKPPVPRSDAEVLRDSPLPIYVHAPYLINVATTDATVRARSQSSLHAACEAAAAIGAAGVVVHGGQLPAGVDPEVGVGHWRETLGQLPTDVPVLIENTAGGQNAMARTVAQVERLWGASPAWTSRWASASTPVTCTPPGRTWSLERGRCATSSAGSR